MADPTTSCPVCAAMYRPETPPDGHDSPAKRPDVPQGQNGTPTAERHTAETECPVCAALPAADQFGRRYTVVWECGWPVRAYHRHTEDAPAE